jgi:hypothetical protein
MRCAGCLRRQGIERYHRKRARPVVGLERGCDLTLEQLVQPIFIKAHCPYFEGSCRSTACLHEPSRAAIASNDFKKMDSSDLRLSIS